MEQEEKERHPKVREFLNPRSETIHYIVAQDMNGFYEQVNKILKEYIDNGLPLQEMMLSFNPEVDRLQGCHSLALWDMRKVDVVARLNHV